MALLPRNEPINAVIFQGAPSQLINLPAFIKGAVAILAVRIGFEYVSTQWPVPWFIPCSLSFWCLAACDSGPGQYIAPPLSTDTPALHFEPWQHLLN